MTYKGEKMKFKYILPIIIFLLAITSTAYAIGSETLDNLIFLLAQPEPADWSDGTFDDAILIEGFEAIYEMSIEEGNDSRTRSVLWAMGETGLASFIPTLINEFENETMIACYALGKISVDASVNALIPMLENEDRYVREASVWGLGNITYGADLDDAKADALEALNDRLDLEEETWIVEMIEAAIILIETGLITDSVFETM